MSESDAYVRQILTYKDDPRVERVNKDCAHYCGQCSMKIYTSRHKETHKKPHRKELATVIMVI